MYHLEKEKVSSICVVLVKDPDMNSPDSPGIKPRSLVLRADHIAPLSQSFDWSGGPKDNTY